MLFKNKQVNTQRDSTVLSIYTEKRDGSKLLNIFYIHR